MDSAREASDVRREEAPEARLGGLLPGIRLTQCSHREELVEPVQTKHHIISRHLYKNRSLAEGDMTYTPLLCYVAVCAIGRGCRLCH